MDIIRLTSVEGDTFSLRLIVKSLRIQGMAPRNLTGGVTFPIWKY